MARAPAHAISAPSHAARIITAPSERITRRGAGYKRRTSALGRKDIPRPRGALGILFPIDSEKC